MNKFIKNVLILLGIFSIIFLVFITIYYEDFNIVYNNNIDNDINDIITGWSKEFGKPYKLMGIIKKVDNNDLKINIFRINTEDLNSQQYGHVIYRKIGFSTYYKRLAYGCGNYTINCNRYQISKNRFLLLLHGENSSQKFKFIKYQINGNQYTDDISNEDYFLLIHDKQQERDVSACNLKLTN